MPENEQECSQSLYFFIGGGGTVQEPPIWLERANFGDRHGKGILLLYTDGMAVHPNSSLFFEGGDAFFICPKRVKGALSKLKKWFLEGRICETVTQ